MCIIHQAVVRDADGRAAGVGHQGATQNTRRILFPFQTPQKNRCKPIFNRSTVWLLTFQSQRQKSKFICVCVLKFATSGAAAVELSDNQWEGFPLKGLRLKAPVRRRLRDDVYCVCNDKGDEKRYYK